MRRRRQACARGRGALLVICVLAGGAFASTAGAQAAQASQTSRQAAQSPPSRQAVRYPCRTRPESHQLDFWVGRWRVTPWGAPDSILLGTSEITPMLEHCAILESWTGAKGGTGKSLNLFDAGTGRWRQLWVADAGVVTDYTGDFRDGAMRFGAESRDAAGHVTLRRLTFTPVAADTVRQLIETSADGGKTWAVGFDGRYVRVK